MTPSRRYSLVLAIYCSTYGFAFVLFEGPFAPYDWGVHGPSPSGADRNRWCLRRIAPTLTRTQPEVLVLQDIARSAIPRTDRIRRLNESVAELADLNGIPIHAYSREEIRACFSHYGVATKDTIAEAIAKQVPALARYAPPRRKVWMSEDRRMALFDAAALAFTFFHTEGNGDRRLP